jgi:hypothetical protein
LPKCIRRPAVMTVPRIKRGDDESGVSDSFHAWPAASRASSP